MRHLLSVALTALSLGNARAAAPVRLSLAESPVPGLRERVETHLVQEFDCVVISRSRASAAAFERSVERLKAISAPALPPRAVPAADRCVQVSAWDFSQLYQVPVVGLRELSWSVTDLSRPPTATNCVFSEKVPERSEYERTLAGQVAKTLGLSPRPGGAPAASKAITLAVLPFVDMAARTVESQVSLPADRLYQHAESTLLECLPDGAKHLSRDRIAQVLAEHNLSALAENGAGLRAVAHLLPADALVCGTVSTRLAHPWEKRLDLHLVDVRGSVLQAAWQGCCTNKAELPSLAAQGMRALMAMPWNAVAPTPPNDANRQREAAFLVSHGCFAEAWDLARDNPDLHGPILRGVLTQAMTFSHQDETRARDDTYQRQMLRETVRLLDDIIGERAYLDSEKERVPWPGLIRAENAFWLGEYEEAERLCRAHLSSHPNDLTERAELILAWALFKQKRIDESRVLLKRVFDSKGPMWRYPRLGGEARSFWPNDLSTELARASGDWRDVYERTKKKMRTNTLITEDEMRVYLREVDRLEGPAQTIQELTSLLIFNGSNSLYPELAASKPLDMTAKGWFSHLCPAYVVRGRCYEKTGQKQKAVEDYALFLRIKKYPFTPDGRFAGNREEVQAPFDAEALDGLTRLQQQGLNVQAPWLTPAQTRPFPPDAGVYVVPVGTNDQAVIQQFVKEAAVLMGSRVTLLPEIAVPRLSTLSSKACASFYNGKEFSAAVLGQLAVPDDVIQLVLVTSESFGFPARAGVQSVGSPDGGATLLLCIKRNRFFFQDRLPAVVAYGLGFRYMAPVSERYKRLDPEVTSTFLRTWDCCANPCLFSDELNIMPTLDKLFALCPRCQEKYRKVDLLSLQKKTVETLKKQGVKIIPSAGRTSAPQASAKQ